jgi:sulfate transport system substrate-binding protein
MSLRGFLGLGGLAVAAVAGVWVLAGGGLPGEQRVELRNVSYDPTRELYRDLNAAFVPRYEAKTGTKLKINQSHNGSSSQARSVIDGLEADVVTLSWWPDVDAIRRKELIDEGWETRLPNRSLPYFSTIVFVVRKGNPKGIKDWDDLVREGVRIVTPNPKTSGNGKLSFLAAWGAVIARGGSEEDARNYITQLYRHTPVLDTGARAATVTFSQKKIGDVHLTWENEAHLEIQETGGELELVYPSVSIRAETPVAVVDAVARRRGTAEHARAYLEFLYTDEAQEIIAKHHYRPQSEAVRKKHTTDLPDLKLFTVDTVAKSWDDAQQKFFAEGGVFDRIGQKK